VRAAVACGGWVGARNNRLIHIMAVIGEQAGIESLRRAWGSVPAITAQTGSVNGIAKLAIDRFGG
jgi:hypothetical protein